MKVHHQIRADWCATKTEICERHWINSEISEPCEEFHVKLSLKSPSEFLVILTDHSVQLFVFTLGVLRDEPPLLLLQVLQFPLQTLQVKCSAVPQQAARERVHVTECDAD